MSILLPGGILLNFQVSTLLGANMSCDEIEEMMQEADVVSSYYHSYYHSYLFNPNPGCAWWHNKFSECISISVSKQSLRIPGCM